MKLAEVGFPATLDELKGMSSAELRVLVGKLENGAELHPKIASMGYHMTKAERVDFIGFHHYGLGDSDAAAKALSNAEVKYAEHQAKKGAAAGIKAASGVATNCSATAGKALADLAIHVPAGTQLGADFDAWAAGMADASTTDVWAGLGKWLKQASQLSADAPAAELDDVMTVGDLIGQWKNLLETGADPSFTPLQQWEAAQYAKKAAVAAEDFTPEAKVLVTSESTKAAVAANQLGLDYSQALFDATFADEPSMGAIVDGLTELAQAPLDALPPGSVASAASAVKDGVDLLVGAFNDGLTTVLPSEDLAVQLNNAFAKATFKLSKNTNVDQVITDGIKATIDATKLPELDQVIHEATATVVDSAVQDAVDATKSLFLQKSKAELKKVGPQLFADAGVDVPSLAHYLTKDELAEALAKLTHDQPIDNLLSVANEKKLAHKAKGTATMKAEKVAGTDVPAFEAAPATADTTALTEEQAATKIAAQEVASPATADAVEESIVPEFTPAPDALDVPQTKYPKPPQTEHTWAPSKVQRKLGGAHRKATFTDEDGNVWMWKVADTKGVAKGEVLANDIGWDLGLDMTDVRYADGWTVPNYGTQPHGTIQLFHQGIKGNMDAFPVGSMSPEQLAELQEHQVFDWLISQHDTHSENILVMQDGHLAPIDKGQAFKFFGKDQLAVGYMPPGNFGRPVYYDLWDAYASGSVDVDLNAIDTILARIESLDNKAYEAKVRDYVAQRMADGGRSLTFLPANLRSEDALVKAIMDRKAAIRDQFTAFYKEQAARRGVKWTPIWEQRLAQASPELIAEAGTQAVAAGITTPITQALADDVSRMGTGGKALHFAGKDITQGQALVYVEQGPNGEKILRLEMRLETAADDRLTTLLQSITGDLGTGNAMAGPGYVADQEWDTVVSFAKTVGAHAEDGAYNTSTVANAQSLLSQIDGKIITAQGNAAKALAADDIDAWAAAKAQAEKLDVYKGHLQMLDQAMKEGVVPPAKAAPFDVSKATEGWKAKAPSAPVTKTEEPAQAIFDKLTLGKDRTARMERTDDYLGYRRTGTSMDVQTGGGGTSSGLPGLNTSGVGKQFDGTMTVDGTKLDIHFRSYQQTSAVPRKGLIDVEIHGWDGSPEAIQKALAAINHMDVATPLATADDEALTYWRVLSNGMKHSIEYAQPNRASGPYAGLRKGIEAIEKKVAEAGNLTPAEEATIYRDGFTDIFGRDAVVRAPERIAHRANIFGDDMGYGYVNRFDLPEDMGKIQPYIHGTRHISVTDFTDLTGASTTEDLVRIGTMNFNDTTSAVADMRTGGATGTFASPKWAGRYSNGNDFFIARPATADRRIGTYLYTDDRFGGMSARTSDHWLDVTKATQRVRGGGEAIIRGGISYGDDMEAVVLRSKAKQEAMLADLRAHGITEIRGRPIEERVLYAQTDAQAKQLVAKITKERSTELLRPYDDVPLVKGAPEPGAAKPKTTRLTKAQKEAKAAAEKAAQVAEPDVPLATDVAADPFPKPTLPKVAGPKVPTELGIGTGDLSNAFADVKNTFYEVDLELVPDNVNQAIEFVKSQLTEQANVSKDVADQLVKKFTANLGALPSDPYAAVQAITDMGSDYFGLFDAVAAQPTTEDAVAFLLDTGDLTVGAKQLIAEKLGQLDWYNVQHAYAEAVKAGFDGPMTEYVKLASAVEHSPATTAATQVLSHDELAAKVSQLFDGTSADLEELAHLAGFNNYDEAYATWANSDDMGITDWFTQKADHFQTLMHTKVPAVPTDVSSWAATVTKGDTLGNQFDALLNAIKEAGVPNAEETFGQAVATVLKGPGTASADETMAQVFAEVEKLAPAPAAPASVLKAADGIKALNPAVPGDMVTSAPLDKTFNYVVPGVKGKLPVQFTSNGTLNETAVIAQHTDGNWYVVANNVTGKTDKAKLITMLQKMGWPGVAP